MTSQPQHWVRLKDNGESGQAKEGAGEGSMWEVSDGECRAQEGETCRGGDKCGGIGELNGRELGTGSGSMWGEANAMA